MTSAIRESFAPARHHVYLPLLLLLPIAAGYLWWSWTDQLVGFGGDNAFYVLMAQSYSPYADADNPVADFFTKQSQFPPLYPMLLAIAGGAHSFLVAHQITTGLLLLALVVLRLWTRNLQLSFLTGLVLVAAVALLPGSYSQTLYLHSENLYLLLTLVFMTIASDNSDSTRKYLALALVAAAAALTRTAGLALILALLCMLAVRRPKSWLVCSALAVAPVVAWNMYAYSLGVHYINSVSPTDGGNLTEAFIERISTQLMAIRYGWIANLTTFASLSPHCLVLGVVCLVGCALRTVALHVDGLYVTAYLGLLLLWPFPSEAVRFVYVVVPILLVQGTWLTMQCLLRISRSQPARNAPVLIPMLAMLIAIPDLIAAIIRIQMPLPGDLADFRRDPYFLSGSEDSAVLTANSTNALVSAINDLRDFVQPTECVIAIKPAIVGVLAQRASMAPPPSAAADGDFFTQLDNAGCRHFLLLNRPSPTFKTPMYPLNRLQNEVTILRTYGITNGSLETTVAAIGLRQHR